LEAEYVLHEPSGTVFWSCQGNPANEFVTTFYDTDPPSARIERGDRTVVALLVPSPSGLRYHGPSGIDFWIDEDSARAESPEGSNWSCAALSRLSGTPPPPR
jgi:hypothetical protein